MFDLYMNERVTAIFFDSLKPAEKQNAEMVAQAHETLDVWLGYVEDSLKKDIFAGGNEFSIADCALFPPLFYAQRLHPFKDRKNISAWFDRMMQRKSVQRLLVELVPELEKLDAHDTGPTLLEVAQHPFQRHRERHLHHRQRQQHADEPDRNRDREADREDVHLLRHA